MPNTLHGPYAATTWVDGTTALNQTRMNNLEKQTGVALASINPDLIGSGFILNGVAATRHNSYASTVLADSPVAYYRLDESSGGNALDASGNGEVLSYNNSPTLGAGSLLTGDTDAAVTFTAASSQYAASGSLIAPLPTGVSPVTLECWHKFSANPASNQFLLSIGDRGTATHVLSLILTTTGAVQLSNVTTAITSAALTTGTRHHLVGTYDGTNLRLYVDGTLAAGPTAATNALTYTGNVIAIASQSGATPGAYYNGQIDECAIYATALSATRVTAHWTNGTTATTQLDVASGTAYLVQSDGTPARCDVVSTNFTSVTINTTYFLDLNPDGSWIWGTSHSGVANHLTIASVATDSLGNTVAVTDLRPLNVTLLPNLAGTLANIPTITHMPEQTVADANFHPFVLQTVPITGFYRVTAQFFIAAGATRNILLSVSYSQGHLNAAASQAFISQNASGVGKFWDGTGTGDSAGVGDAMACSYTIYLKAGSTLVIRFQDAGWTSGNNLVNAFAERLS